MLDEESSGADMRPAGDGKRGERDEQPAKPTDFLANERTFLAWTRTGIALVALGFVVARFGLLLRELAQRSGVNVSIGSQHISSLFGAGIVLLGAVLLALSYLRYHHVARMLQRGVYHDNPLLVAALGAVSVIISLLLVVYLLLT